KEKQKYGELEEIGREDYNKVVVDGSKDISVVCLLYKDSIPHSVLLTRHLHSLARIYPSTKFVKIVSTRCIENYPDRAVPTMLIYKNGEMAKQIVGLGTDNEQ
ncbi:thioredoxin-like protein, partial [Atractiella rhizophila]